MIINTQHLFTFVAPIIAYSLNLTMLEQREGNWSSLHTKGFIHVRFIERGARWRSG